MDSHLGRRFTTGSDASADPGKKRDPCQWTDKKKMFVTKQTDSIERHEMKEEP
jgi:hypothetical protein